MSGKFVKGKWVQETQKELFSEYPPTTKDHVSFAELTYSKGVPRDLVDTTPQDNQCNCLVSTTDYTKERTRDLAWFFAGCLVGTFSSYIVFCIP